MLAPQFTTGTLQPQKASAAITMPDQFVVGIAVKPTDKVMLLFDYQYNMWSVFDVLEITGDKGLESKVYEDYENTHGFRFGTEFGLGDKMTLRGGIVRNTAGAPDQTVTPSLPEGPLILYTLGGGLKMSEKIHGDLYWAYLDQDDRRGRSGDCGVERPTTACNNGLYTFRGNLFGGVADVRVLAGLRPTGPRPAFFIFFFFFFFLKKKKKKKKN